jgi:hypothetical protein
MARRVRDLLHGLLTGAKPMPTSTAPDSPATPNSPPVGTSTAVNAASGGLKRKLVYIGLTILLSALSAVISRYTGVPVQIPVPVPQQVAEPIREDLVPVDYEGCSFHGHDHDDHAEAIESNGKPWPVQRITWGVDYTSAKGLNPPLSDSAIQTAVKTAWGWWGESLDLEFVEVPHAQAMIPIRFERIDGAAGVLAEAYLADGTTRPKPMRLDASERWNASGPSANQVSLPAVLCHEGGHSLGLGHDSTTAPAVMRPTYSSTLPREQPRDIDRAVQLGYRRRVVLPGDGSKPGGTATVLDFPVSAKASDLIGALRKAGYIVSEPK